MPERRPNILFIVVDDCGYADLGCTGQTDYRTPSLDLLAAEGIRFTQAYANSALCTNTRVALITGRYQYRLPIGLVEPLRWSDREAPEMGVPPGVPTLPALLHGAGYRTALIGKWHLGYLPRYSPLKSGYDEFFGIMGGFTGYYTHIGDGGEHDFYEGETPVERAGYVTDLLSDRAAAWVSDAAARPEPYFLSLHYTAPHWPWSAPSVEEAARRREVERTELTEGGNTRIYGEMMQILDAGIGRVLDAVRQAPGGDNTLVVFTSDNGGERFSNIWPFVGRKFDLLEGGLSVPQICRWPGHIGPGLVTDQVCITMDLTATCLAAAGVAPAPDYQLDGVDLLPVLTGQAAPVRAHALLAHAPPLSARGAARRLEIPEGRRARVPVRHCLRPARTRRPLEKAPRAARRTARTVGGLGPRHAAVADRRGDADVEFVRHALVVLDSPFCYCGQ